jgi:hypothetical protein
VLEDPDELVSSLPAPSRPAALGASASIDPVSPADPPPDPLSKEVEASLPPESPAPSEEEQAASTAVMTIAVRRPAARVGVLMPVRRLSYRRRFRP